MKQRRVSSSFQKSPAVSAPELLNEQMSNSEMMKLCINSNVNTDDGAFFFDGHAWLTLQQGEDMDGYGLYPDGHTGIMAENLDNGAGSDVRHNFEEDKYSGEFQYCESLTEQQMTKFQQERKKPAHWSETNNCSSWASDTFYEITGTDVDADDEWILGVETPRELGQNITRLNKQTKNAQGQP